jgi:WD40 repeat protein
VATDDNKFVVGLDDGTVHVYHEKTFQKKFDLNHGEPVRRLAFPHSNGLLASAGRRTIKLWDLTSKTTLWTSTLDGQLLAFGFHGG